MSPRTRPPGKVLAHECHEPTMGNGIEVAFDIDVYDVRVLFLEAHPRAIRACLQPRPDRKP